MNQEYQPHDLLAQQAAERETEEARRLQQKLDDDDFQWLMADKRGRRIVWRWLGLAAPYRNAFTAQRESTDFNLGKQLIGQTMIADIHRLCPDLYAKMVTENSKHVRKRTRTTGD